MAHASVSPNLPCSERCGSLSDPDGGMVKLGCQGGRGGAGCGCQFLSRMVQVCSSLPLRRYHHGCF